MRCHRITLCARPLPTTHRRATLLFTCPPPSPLSPLSPVPLTSPSTSFLTCPHRLCVATSNFDFSHQTTTINPVNAIATHRPATP